MWTIYSILYISDNEKCRTYLYTFYGAASSVDLIGFLLRVFIKDLDYWEINSNNEYIESNKSNIFEFAFFIFSRFIILASKPEKIQLNFIYMQISISLINLILNLVFVKSKLQGEETRILDFTKDFETLHIWDKYHLINRFFLAPIINYLVISNLQKWIHSD